MNTTARIELRHYRAGPAGHRHAHHQIVVALEGLMTIDVGGHAGVVSRDVAALVPRDALHAFDARADSRFIVVDLPAGVGDGFGGSPPTPLMPPIPPLPPGPFVPVGADVRGYLDLLATRTIDGALPAALARPAASLAVELLRDARPEPPLPPSVARACRVLEHELVDPPDVAGLARRAGKSAARLHALFREHLGTTPGRYLEARRMDEAERLLDSTALSVARVAEAVGFADASSFGRAFRRARGLAPLEWRRRAGRAH